MAQTMASLNGITSEVSSRLESGYCNVEAGILNNWVGALLHKENTIKAQIVNGVIAAGLVLGGVCTALCQLGSEKDATIPTIRTTSTLVIVPTLVRSKTGKLIQDLRPGDFALTDNGVEQKVFAEQVKNQGLAIAVLMETGAAAPRDFQNYSTLTSMLNVTASRSTHKVALVTFDSRPQQIWNFPPRTDGLEYAFRHPVSGDRGAAIMDAVNRGIDLLREQPATLGRVILLLSQPQDLGSTNVTGRDCAASWGEQRYCL